MTWFYTALLTPIISALVIIISKKLLKNIRVGVLVWITYTLSNLIVIFFAFKNGIPNINKLFFVGILGSISFYILYKVYSFKAIRVANLSYVYPIATLSPIFTLLIAYLPPLSEKPSFLAIVGIFITIFGCYLLNIKSLKQGFLKPFQILFQNKASALMFFSVFVGSIVPIFDKIAIKNTQPQNTSFVLFMENFFIFLFLLPILYKQDKHFLKPVVNNFIPLLGLGILTGLSNILVMFALGATNVAFIQTILRTQILFVLLFSWLFFGDKPKTEVWIGSLIMIFGVVLIKLGA